MPVSPPGRSRPPRRAGRARLVHCAARLGRAVCTGGAGGRAQGHSGAEGSRAQAGPLADRAGPQVRQRRRRGAGPVERQSCVTPSSASSRRARISTTSAQDGCRARRSCASWRTSAPNAKAQLAVERDALAGELRTAYVNGREEQLKLLLNQQDPAQVGRMLTWYGYFGRARADAHRCHTRAARGTGRGARGDRG